MRPPDQVKRELLRQWLAKAEEDFSLAGFLVSQKTPYVNAVGFHAQQAAEKYLKAFLVNYQIEFPKTHDLGELLDLVASVDSSLAASLRDATMLNPYGVDIRYPAEFPDMTPEEAEKALGLAGKVRAAIQKSLGRSGARS
jgi:HEPN domain-containing protein